MTKRRSAKFTPPPSWLIAAAAQNLGWRKALAELFDNAIDKGATRLDIFEGPTKNKVASWFEIRDDGTGCPDPVIMTTWGKRGEKPNGAAGACVLAIKQLVFDTLHEIPVAEHGNLFVELRQELDQLEQQFANRPREA